MKIAAEPEPPAQAEPRPYAYGLEEPDDERLMLLVEAAGTLIGPSESASMIERIFKVALRVVEADAYAVWLFDPLQRRWDAVSSYGLSSAYLKYASIPVTDGTPTMSETLVVPDVFAEPMLEGRLDGYREEGVASILVVALRVEGENRGSLTFYYRQPHAADPREIRIAEALGNMASAAIDASRMRARQEAVSTELAEANRRLEILVKASSLLSEPLELLDDPGGNIRTQKLAVETPLAKLANLLVPTLGDICVLDVFLDEGAAARIELATSPGVRQDLLVRSHLRDWRTDGDGEETVGARMARGKALILPQIDDALIERCAPDAEHAAIGRGMGVRSLMMAPMMARGVVIGTFTLASLGSHEYGPTDLDWLESLAKRTAGAIENERLFRDAQETAAKLREANDAKDEFLGLVSHELRTPLTIIRGNAGAISRHRGRLPQAELEAGLQDIINESERLNRIVENLLLLARVEQGQAPEREPILVVRVIERVVERRRRLTPGRRFRIVENGDPRAVSFPEGYLEQVVENLISNATKYSPPDKLITIDLQRSDTEVRVEVRDRGRGIDEQDIDHLFDAFYRSDRTSNEAAGIGIGLAVCRRLVEAQGGHIWGRSRLGGGAVFGFSLPILSD